MSSDTLVLLHTLFRHGERTPDRSEQYPNDPYLHDEFLPYGPGQLTNVGRKTMYDLGQILRNIYNAYLGDQYMPKYVDAFATNYDRTKAALQLVLASLYPPKGANVWHEDLPWQPIPYNSCPLTDDDILGGLAEKPGYLKAYHNYFDNDGGKAYLEERHEVVDFLRKHTGTEIKSTREVWMLAGALQTQRQFGLDVPAWVKTVIPGITELVAYEYKSQPATKELKRWLVGNLLQKIVSDTRAKISGKSNCKIHIYSAHECNIVHLLSYFGIMYPHFPNYASCIILEVHQIQEKYEVKLKYREEKSVDFRYMNFSNGSDVLDFDDFVTGVDDLLTYQPKY